MYTRKKQYITMAILIIGVIALSIGFAVFSSTLNIASQATVTPDSGNFSVVFTKTSGTIDTAAVVPTKSPNTITATSGTINNQNSPTISNLSATFTAPNQTVTYTFYVYNAGEYLANLNSITFKGNKSCTPNAGTTASLVSSACNSITTTVSVDGITTSETRQNITGKTLAKGASKQVTVTLSYAANGAVADGPFTVTFPDISLYYNTVSGVNEPVVKNYVYRWTTDNLAIGASLNSLTWIESLSNVNKKIEATPLAPREPEEPEPQSGYTGKMGITLDYTKLESNYFLRHEVDGSNNIVSSDVCFISNNTLYCLSPNDYENSLATMHRADSNCNSNSCTISGLNLYADAYGSVTVSSDSSQCDVNSVGNSYCSWRGGSS